MYSSSFGGGIAKSVDAGYTWTYPANQVSFFVKGVCMATSSTGYYYTYDNSCNDITCKMSNIYRTTDAGCSWTLVSSPTAPGNTEYITGLTFSDANTGWCSTSAGNIFKTTTGGTSWNLQTATGIVLFTIKCFNSQLVVATGTNSKVFCTNNGGLTWITNILNAGSSYVEGIAFADVNTIYVAAGKIYRSNDGGLSWQLNFSLPLFAGGFLDIAFRDPGYGIAIASGGLPFKTVDGGNTWVELTNDGLLIDNIAIKDGTEIASSMGTILKNQPTQNSYWKIISNGKMTIATMLKYSHDGTTAFIDGKLSGRLQKSFDYGKNWKTVNFENSGYGSFNSISKDDAGNGIAVGRFGSVFNTLNNGQDWKFQFNNYPLPVQTNDLWDVQLNNSGIAWAVGQTGTIIHSIDKGVNWQTQNSTIIKDLFSVSFIDDNLGFAAGYNNILKTSNGGASWQIAYSDIYRTFREVKCITPTVLYAISNSFSGSDTTFLLKSIDGGNTWNRTLTLTYPYSFYTVVPLVGISVIGPSELRAYTTDSIYYSNNGGQSWQSSFFGYPIGKIKFLNSNQGYLLSGQSIFFTANAGQSWNVYSPLDVVDFQGIDVKPGKVSICGTKSAILNNENSLSTRDDWQFQLQPRELIDGNAMFDFLDSLHGWKFHLINRGVSYTSNGGKSWKVNSIISYSIDTTLSDLQFTTINKGYATDNHGNFLKTVDNGKTWQYVSVSQSGETLNSISFYDDNYGFFAGTNGLFVYTTNGGVNFTTGHLPSGENIGKIICTSPNAAWLRTVDKVYFTNDNGTSWTVKPLPTSTTVGDIAFINDSTGWAISYPGGVPSTYATTNFGVSWTATPLVGNVMPYGISVSSIAFNKLKQGIAITDGLAVGQGYLYILPSVIDSLTADFIIDTLDFCKRQIKLTVRSSVPLTSVNWNLGGQSYTGSPLIVTLPSTPDSLRINLYSEAQSTATCSQVFNLTDTVSKMIRFDTLPTAKFIYDSSCNHGMISFKNQSIAVIPSNFWWAFGDGQISIQKDPTHNYITPGSYKVHMVAYSKNGCPSDTASAIVATGKSIALPISKSNDIDCSNAFANLSVPAGFKYVWTPNVNIDNPFIANPIVNPTSTQLYIVKIKDTTGCIVNDSITVNVNSKGAADIFVPNAFTPNGDNRNDCIGVKTSGSFEYFDFSIYNRYGEMVFHTQNPNDCWDGRYKGQLQGISAFVYIIKAKNGCGTFEKKGTLILIL